MNESNDLLMQVPLPLSSGDWTGTIPRMQVQWKQKVLNCSLDYNDFEGEFQ